MSIKETLTLVGKKIYKNRANIAFVVGDILKLTGTGLAIKATHDCEPTICDTKVKLSLIGDDKVEKRRIYIDTSKKVAKKAALPITVSAVGYALGIYANSEHNKDLAIVNAALTSANVAYATIREKFKEKYGDDAWRQLSGVTNEEIVDPETGAVTKNVTLDTAVAAPHLVCFDEANKNFSSNPGDNRRFIQLQLKFANQDLSSKGYLTYKEFLENYLGYDMTPGSYFSKDQILAMSIAGWFYHNTDGTTNYIDIGLNSKDDVTVRFLKDLESSFILEPNFCANIYNHI